MDRVDAARGSVMRLAGKCVEPGFSVAVAQVAGGTSQSGTAPAFVLITVPRTRPLRLDAMLRQVLDLSAAETRVAERLMMGDTPERVAESLCVRVSTVRWHLASLYRKTGTSRQAELLQVLLSVPT